MPDILIPGPIGFLEAKYYQQTDSKKAPIILFLHPHPQYGGTMNNKVVHTLYKTFADNGFNVLRFNFRGVGRSEGRYDNGDGELSDAAAALDWFQANNPFSAQCWIAGFSFGAWIAMQLLMRRPELSKFVVVSPPVNLYDFSFLAPCPTSGKIIQGTKDNIVHCQDVLGLSERLLTQKNIDVECQLIEEADHYFAGYLTQLSKIAEEYIKKNVKKESYCQQRIA
jgi:alpha/beta superfamily hydrolase